MSCVILSTMQLPELMHRYHRVRWDVLHPLAGQDQHVQEQRWMLFPGILNLNGQNDTEVQGQLPLISIPTESIIRCMFGSKSCDSCSKLTSYHSDKVKFTDGRMDRRRQRQYPFRMKDQLVKCERISLKWRYCRILITLHHIKKLGNIQHGLLFLTFFI